MKLIYLQPEIEMFSSYSEGSLMAATLDSKRQIGGGPTDEGMPSVVGEIEEDDDETDPYGGHGVGTGGGGNRSKSGMIWDEW